MKKKGTAGEVIFQIANYTIFGLFTLICILPFYYLFINTISDNSLVSQGLILWKPKGIHFTNYMEVLKMKGLGNSALISVGRTVLGTVLNVFGTAFLGYALGKQELWGRKFWYRFVIITMYFNAGIIPWFINMKNLGLTNNFLAYIINNYDTWTLRDYYLAKIKKELAEYNADPKNNPPLKDENGKEVIFP